MRCGRVTAWPGHGDRCVTQRTSQGDIPVHPALQGLCGEDCILARAPHGRRAAGKGLGMGLEKSRGPR